MWYAAHIIEWFQYRDGNQSSCTIWENVVLIQAPDPRAAWAKAEAIGRKVDKFDDPSFTLNGRPARAVFAGIRKVIEVLDFCDNDGVCTAPGDGTEITYSTFVLDNEDELRAFVRGDGVNVYYDQDRKESGEEAEER